MTVIAQPNPAQTFFWTGQTGAWNDPAIWRAGTAVNGWQAASKVDTATVAPDGNDTVILPISSNSVITGGGSAERLILAPDAGPVTLAGDGDDIYNLRQVEVLDRILSFSGSVLVANNLAVDQSSLVDFSAAGTFVDTRADVMGRTVSADINSVTLADDPTALGPFTASPAGPYASRGDGGLLVLGEKNIVVRTLSNPDVGGSDPLARVFGDREHLIGFNPGASKPTDSGTTQPEPTPTGTPGTATKQFADAYQAQAARLYDTVFDRAGDTGGLEFWTNHLRAGVPLTAVADGFTAAPEFQSRYGTPDDREFTGLLYRNVLDREAEPQGLAFWSGLLSEFTASRAQVVVGFSESPEHVALITADRALV